MKKEQLLRFRKHSGKRGAQENELLRNQPDVRTAAETYGAAVPPAKGWRRLKRTFAALSYPNYRLWFMGQLVSLFGTWMQTTAQGFLIYELTHSALYLGYVGFAGGIPSWLFTLYGGVVADRLQRRNLMIVTQASMMAFAFVLATLTFLHAVEPWHVLLLAFFLGVANAFDAPARQAFVTELVPREDLTNAIALNSTMFNTATAVGPAVAGMVYALFGPAWCFMINGASFIAVITALSLMKLAVRPRAQTQGRTLHQLLEGIRYVIRQRVVFTLNVLVAATSLFAVSFSSIAPAWTVNILHGDATVNGLLFSARGAGSLLGALSIASLGRFSYKGRLLMTGAFIFPLFFAIFAFVRWIPLALLLLAGAGMGMIFVMNLCNALIQTITPDHLRGRVMGVYSLVFFGSMPLGALWAGTLAGNLGEQTAVLMSAGAMVIVAVIITLVVPQVREQ